MNTWHSELQGLLCDMLCEARRNVRRLPLPELDWSYFSVEDALAVQRQQAARLGWFPDGHPSAWKLGGSPTKGPSTAPVPAEAVFDAPWRSPDGFAVGFGIEAELAVRLARDLPAGASTAEARQAIDCFFPCIELCDTRIASAEPLPAVLQLADQQSNRALVLGPATRLAAVPDWPALAVRVECGGRVVHESTGGHPYLDPLTSLPWLAQHAVTQYDGLRAGDIIATGTWSGIYWALPGETVCVSLAGIGSVELEL